MDNSVQGTVFDIQRFCTHDGPGIRTTVFLKGCPLRCLWCHNPESQNMQQEESFAKDKCTGCGDCAKTDGHICQTGARTTIGYQALVSEVMQEVLQDKIFYQSSGGGITISGGEPLYQPAFTKALFQSAKDEGLHTCIETCGYAAKDKLIEILPLIDLFLFDIKETDNSRHLQFTGVPFDPIRNNLQILNKHNAAIILRCPLIPGLNANKEHCLKIGELAHQMENVIRIEIEPYHPLGIAKSEQIGQQYPLPQLTQFLSPEETEHWIEIIKSTCDKPVLNIG